MISDKLKLPDAHIEAPKRQMLRTPRSPMPQSSSKFRTRTFEISIWTVALRLQRILPNTFLNDAFPPLTTSVCKTQEVDRILAIAEAETMMHHFKKPLLSALTQHKRKRSSQWVRTSGWVLMCGMDYCCCTRWERRIYTQAAGGFRVLRIQVSIAVVPGAVKLDFFQFEPDRSVGKSTWVPYVTYW